MPASRFACLLAVSSFLACGCSSEKKIDLGSACMLNSDCNKGLVCTWGNCHAACLTTADCPLEQSCIVASGQASVCQLPNETRCVYNSDCKDGLLCATDRQCRQQCQTNVDCTAGQKCTTSKTCAEPNQVDTNNSLLLPDGGFGGCPAGTETCACYPNDTCNMGLTCASHLCVAMGTGSADGGRDVWLPDDIAAMPDAPVGGAGGGTGGIAGTGGVLGTGGSSAGCPMGAETCACYPNDTCNAGLHCASRLCVSLGTGGAGGAGGSTALRDASVDVLADVPRGTGGVTQTGGVSSTGGRGGAGGTASDGATATTSTCQGTTLVPSTCDGVDADCDALVDNGLCNEVLLAHMDGTEGSSAFVDSSPWSHVLQVVGNVRISTATSRFGGASMHSSGGGENHVSAINSDDWQLGTGDFTLDAWANIDVLPPSGDGNGYALVGRFAGAGDGWAIFLMNSDYANDGWAFLVNAGGQRAISVTQGILAQATGVWTHVAVTRQGTVFRLFVDGKAVSTVSTSVAITDTSVPLLIGSDSGRGFRGYIDEVHLVKGVALWTADFTPPTAPYP